MSRSRIAKVVLVDTLIAAVLALQLVTSKDGLEIQNIGFEVNSRVLWQFISVYLGILSISEEMGGCECFLKIPGATVEAWLERLGDCDEEMAVAISVCMNFTSFGCEHLAGTVESSHIIKVSTGMEGKRYLAEAC